MATGDTRATDATTAQGPEAGQWLSIDWVKVNREVQRLQQRIFCATQAGQWRTVRNLQKLLLRSQANLALAVRQATQVNAGRNTPGVDGKVADTAEKRGKLLHQIRSTGAHRVQPVRRVYIPKANGKQRPLGIPIWAAHCLPFQAMFGIPLLFLLVDRNIRSTIIVLLYHNLASI